MKGLWSFLAVAATAVFLSGCGGEKEDTEALKSHPAVTESKPSPYPCTPPGKRLNMTLDGRVGAENVGILMAKKRGFFADAGIRIWIGSPGRPNSPVGYVASGLDLGVAQMPQVAISKARGMQIIAVGSVISRPTASMIWLRGSKIRGIADLAGKTIAVPGAIFQIAILKTVLARAGLTLKDVKVKRIGYELVPALLEGRADAIFGVSSNIEGVDLRLRGAKPVITRVQDLGVPDYEELVLIARTKCASKYPQVIRKFLAAVARGTEAAERDPESAASLIEESVESNPESSPKQVEAEVRATLPLLSRRGYMDPSKASELNTWMYEQGLIHQEPPVSGMLSNDYLALQP